MKKANNFPIEVTQKVKNNKEKNTQNQNKQKQRIDYFKDIVKMQYDEIIKSQDVDITEGNKKEIEDLIFATQDLIDNCIRDSCFSGNRDERFVNLIYICHKLELKLETYKLESKINELKFKSVELEIFQDNLNERQNKTEEQNNNLVYNLLGFLTAFSIVSASVEAISNIKGIINVMLFMAFTILLLLTALIALHNFYKNNNKRETRLQDKYFLWKIVAVIIVFLIIISGVMTLKDNKEKIFNYVDNKIEEVIEEKVNQKINNEELAPN